MQKTVIFDFDGTIADTFELIVDVSYELSGVSRLPASKIAPLKKLPLLVAVPKLGIRWWQIPRLLTKTRSRMLPRMGEVLLFPGVADAVAKLHASGHRLLILSSNSPQNVWVFLRAYHLDQYFEGVYGVPYGSVPFKARGLWKVRRRLKLQASDCFYVGNEAVDIRAAEHAGMQGVAVTWSGQDKADLADAQPFAVAEKPADILDIVEQ